MTLDETMEKLTQLRLGTMALALREVCSQAPSQQLSFEEKIGLVVDREWTHRENRRLERRIKDAKLPVTASPEDTHCEPSRGLERATLRQLATCDWVRAKQGVLITGATGVGKSYLAASLANAACRKGFRALYTRVPRLLQELVVARADGSYGALLQKLGRIDVLVLDDFLLAPLKDTERRDLLEVLEDRYGHSSTIVTSQYAPKLWHGLLADPTLADAICDRLIHNSHELPLTGPSLRKKNGVQTSMNENKH